MKVSSKCFLQVWTLVLFAAPMCHVHAQEEKQAEAAGRKGEYKLEAPGVATRVFVDVYTRYTFATPEEIKRYSSYTGDTISETKDAPASWEVYVPENYDPATPWGVMAYINSGDQGRIPADWKPVHEKHRLIWAAANDSGNDHNTPFRHALAIEAVRLLKQQYNIDPDRVYISGNSGGGRVASQVMVTHSDIFAGGYPHIGANGYRDVPLKDNKFLPTMLKPIDKEQFKESQQNNRFVFLTADKDFNQDQVKRIHDAYQADGFKLLTYLQIPGAAHARPNGEWYEKGVVALDAPLRAAAPDLYESAKKAQTRKKLDDALFAFRRAMAHGGEEKFVADAAEQYKTIKKEYDDDLAEITTLLDAGKKPDASRKLASFRRRWPQSGKADADALAPKTQPTKK